MSSSDTFNLHALKDALTDPNLELVEQFTPTNESHLVPKLPLELRLKIWGYNRGQTILLNFEE